MAQERLPGILRAGRAKPAGGAEHGGDQQLVDPDQRHRYRREDILFNGGLPRHSIEKIIQRREDGRRRQTGGGPLGDDIEVQPAGKTVPVQPEVLPAEPFQPVSHHRPAHLSGDGDAQARPFSGPGSEHQKEMPVPDLPAMVRKPDELGPLAQPVRLGERIRRQRPVRLGRQAFPALGAAAVDDPPALLGGHSLQKAMGPGALDPAGLKGSFHLGLHSGCGLTVKTVFL